MTHVAFENLTSSNPKKSEIIFEFVKYAAAKMFNDRQALIKLMVELLEHDQTLFSVKHLQ